MVSSSPTRGGIPYKGLIGYGSEGKKVILKR